MGSLPHDGGALTVFKGSLPSLRTSELLMKKTPMCARRSHPSSTAGDGFARRRRESSLKRDP
jgi:hypothetical protein